MILKEIQITPFYKGLVALVPDYCFNELNKHVWNAYWNPKAKTFYARRHQKLGEYTHYSKRKDVWMHREVLQLPDEVMIDHADHNGLHNYPPNIRLATHSQNQMNQRVYKNSSSGLKGVNKRRDRTDRDVWRVRIQVGNKRIHIGDFYRIIDAAKAYNAAAIKYFGEFAYLNLIPCEAA